VIAVDTNVLFDAANATTQFHAPSRNWLDRQRRKPDAWFVTWGIVYEFLRLCTHPRILPRPWTAPGAWGFVAGLLESPGLAILTPTARHADVLEGTLAEMPHLAGNIVHDTHTAVLMREHGIRQICTRDTDFSRFPFLEVIDPLRA
jgi:toxin-antitoxin system PIN domain toxin